MSRMGLENIYIRDKNKAILLFRTFESKIGLVWIYRAILKSKQNHATAAASAERGGKFK